MTHTASLKSHQLMKPVFKILFGTYAPADGLMSPWAVCVCRWATCPRLKTHLPSLTSSDQPTLIALLRPGYRLCEIMKPWDVNQR